MDTNNIIEEGECVPLREVTCDNGNADNMISCEDTSIRQKFDDEEDLDSRIFNAIYFGNLNELKDILETIGHRKLHTITDTYKYTPLHYTTFDGPCENQIRRNIAEFLLDFTDDPKTDILNARDFEGNTPLHLASENERLILIELFLERSMEFQVSAYIKQNNGLTALHLMAEGKSKDPQKVELFKKMFEYGKSIPSLWDTVEPNFVFKLGQIAARAGSEGILKYLLEPTQGLSLDVPLGQELTPILHCIVMGKQLYSDELIEGMITKVGNQISNTSYGDSLVHLAARVRNTKILAQVLSTDAIMRDILIFKRRNKTGETPFHCLAYGMVPQRLFTAVNDLIEHPRSIQKSNLVTRAVFELRALLGVKKDAVECLTVLLEKCRSFHVPRQLVFYLMARDNSGQTILSLACENRALDIIEFLLDEQFDGVPDPWLNSESLAKIYETFPTILIPRLSQQIELGISTSFSSNEISINFSYIIGQSKNLDGKDKFRDSFAIYSILDADLDGRNKVLNHPLVKLYLKKKWDHFYGLAGIWLALQLIFVFSFNTLAIFLYGSTNGVEDTNPGKTSSPESKDMPWPWYIPTLSVITLFLTILIILKEVTQMWSAKWKYVVSPLNIFQILVVVAAALVVVDGFTNKMRDNYVRVGIVAFGSFLSVFLLIREFGKLPGCERFFEVLIAVIKSSLKILLLYLPCLLAFTLAFRILMKKNEKFHLPYGFVKIFSMAIGELDYAEVFATQKESEGVGPFILIMYLLFAFLAAIVLINLLIAFAVSDIQTLLKDAEMSRLASQLKLIYTFEHFLRNVALSARDLGGGLAERYIENRFFLSSFHATDKLESMSLDLRLQIQNLNRPSDNGGDEQR